MFCYRGHGGGSVGNCRNKRKGKELENRQEYTIFLQQVRQCCREDVKETADEMLDYRESGMSVMEMSHRSKVYDNIIKEAEQDLRDLMNIPDNYKVLFLQGGASQ